MNLQSGSVGNLTGIKVKSTIKPPGIASLIFQAFVSGAGKHPNAPAFPAGQRLQPVACKGKGSSWLHLRFVLYPVGRGVRVAVCLSVYFSLRFGVAFLWVQSEDDPV